MSFSVHNTTEFPNQPGPGHNDQCTWQICPVSRSIFRYQPILAYAVVPLVSFSMLTLGHAFMGIKHRAWSFMMAMVVGCLLEAIGYMGRLLAHDDPFDDTWYMLQICVLTFAPVFFCAAIYLSLSQIVTIHGPHKSRIPPVWYTRIFITCDVLSLAVQAAGGGIAAGAADKASHDLGTRVMVGALCFQVFTIFVFSMLGAEFAWRTRHDASQGDIATETIRSSFRWKGFLCALPISTVLIFIRCVYRVIEMSEGYGGALIVNQDTFLIFEGVVVILATLVLLVFHPGFSFQHMKKYESSQVNLTQEPVSQTSRSRAGMESLYMVQR